MPQINFYLDEEGDDILLRYCKEYKLNSKGDALRKIIKELVEEEDGNS